jgi:hypothetical protein
MWSRGQAIVVRHVYGGRVFTSVPARVVADDPAYLALWIAPATHCVYPEAFEDGRVRALSDWGTRPHTWYGNGNLDVMRPGRAHMIRHFWHDDGSFRGWYVNLQEPHRRTTIGVDSADHALDLWIEPDRSVTWKDEQHVDDAVEVGLFDAAQAHAIRVEAERVLAEWPFPTGWEDFRPDPFWEPPELPEGWDVVD